MASTWIVTGYVRLECEHRTHGRYMELGQRLLDLGLPTVTYRQPLQECWLAKHYSTLGVEVEPGGKDTLAYFCVQHEKSHWLAAAARGRQTGTLIWVDYGILHVPGVTGALVREFYAYVDSHPPTHVSVPGIWPASAPVDDRVPCWICAGGVLVMPAWAADWWHRQCVLFATHSQPTWEVNTWAKVCQAHPEQVRHYRADHDQTLLTGIAA